MFTKRREYLLSTAVPPLVATWLIFFVMLRSPMTAQEPAHRLIVGWDDAVIVCGPGTVAGMDSHDRWMTREGQASDITIDNDVSYGHELHSLRIRGNGGRVQLAPPELTWRAEGLLLVDVDIFPRSELPYVQITPGPNVVSSDQVGFALITTGDNQPLIELRTHQSTWHYRDGDKLIDTKVSAAFDAWNHLQLVIDPTNNAFQMLLQVVGEAPSLPCKGSLSRNPDINTPIGVELFCSRSTRHVDGPAFDNLQVTRRISKAQP